MRILALLILVAGAASADTSGRRRPSSPSKYNPRNYNSRLIAKNANREVWILDPREVDYLRKNLEHILRTELILSAFPNGGMKIEKLPRGSFFSARGLKAGDVLENINGKPVHSMRDLRTHLRGAWKRRRSRLMIRRLGRTITLEYRLNRRR